MAKTKTKANKKPAIACGYDDLVEPSKLIPHPMNPNTHPREQVLLLAAIMLEHGIQWPIAVSKLSGYIVAGHCRQLSAIELGIKYPVVYIEYANQQDEIADVLADNKIAELADIDVVVLSEAVNSLVSERYPLALTAFEKQELESLIDNSGNVLDGLFNPIEFKEQDPTICPHCGAEVP